MELSRPFAVVTPTLDGDVLGLLAGGDVKLSGRQISKRIGASQEGVRRVLERLVSQGVVLREHAGGAHLFSLNRQHLAAEVIEGLAVLRLTFIRRLRATIGGWPTPPAVAALFGSAARGDMTPESDIDILVVRPAEVDEDDREWREQVVTLEAQVSALTGNDARVVEYSDAEVERLARGRLFVSVREEGIALFGSLTSLRAAKRER